MEICNQEEYPKSVFPVLSYTWKTLETNRRGENLRPVEIHVADRAGSQQALQRRGWWRREQPWRHCQGVRCLRSACSRFACQVPLRIRSTCRRVNTEARDRGPQKGCFQGGPSAGIWELGPGEGPPHPLGMASGSLS